MNALLRACTPIDDAVLWLCVKHPPQTMSRIARVLGSSPGNLSFTMRKLRERGYLDTARASTIPTPRGLEHVKLLERRGYRLPGDDLPRADAPLTMKERVTEMGYRDAGTLLDCVERIVNPRAMEPRGSIGTPVEPPLTALIDRLASFQDPLLAMANAQLRLRVSELEARNACLEKQLEETLQRLAFAADAVTG